MKSAIRLAASQKKNEYAYPCLKQPKLRDGLNTYVVMFTARRTGVVVFSGPDAINTMGMSVNYWSEDDFELVPEGTVVTLSA